MDAGFEELEIKQDKDYYDPTKIYLKPVEPDISRNVGALQQMVNESTISNDSVEGIEPIKK